LNLGKASLNDEYVESALKLFSEPLPAFSATVDEVADTLAFDGNFTVGLLLIRFYDILWLGDRWRERFSKPLLNLEPLSHLKG